MRENTGSAAESAPSNRLATSPTNPLMPKSGAPAISTARQSGVFEQHTLGLRAGFLNAQRISISAALTSSAGRDAQRALRFRRDRP